MPARFDEPRQDTLGRTERRLIQVARAVVAGAKLSEPDRTLMSWTCGHDHKTDADLARDYLAAVRANP